MSLSEINDLRAHMRQLLDDQAAAFVSEIARLERRITALEAKKPVKG